MQNFCDATPLLQPRQSQTELVPGTFVDKMIHSRLHPLPSHENDNDNDESPEDLFTSSLWNLFPDDAPSFHGDPGQCLRYASPRYGNLTIMVPSYPGQGGGGGNSVEQGRALFAHLLWSAAMVVAEGVEDADDDSQTGARSMWRVKGERVLELGAGRLAPLSLNNYMSSCSYGYAKRTLVCI